MKKLFLATGNRKKIKEISEILVGYEILSINDGYKIPDVVEDRDSFEGNSQKKALEIAKVVNMPVIADDSGLCVEGLGGAPGIYSARYSGENATDESNNKLLIEKLKSIENKKAKFVCVITLAKPSGEYHSFRGEVEGLIVEKPGGTDGFGYDPHFYVEKYGKTMAEIPEIKKKISHRAKALEKMKLEVEKYI
ncbi:MAG: RdgB/HAM1 family non-canonical purine NTP pyrophosphatase [Psychrilyobacter sp.]|nr:RdgB/HAM1 family non-canonical purine NTP pyrophosphatase [Psychrilyobacter sp.]